MFSRCIFVLSLFILKVTLIGCATLEIEEDQEVLAYLHDHNFVYEDRDAGLESYVFFGEEQTEQVVIYGTSIISSETYGQPSISGLQEDRREIRISGSKGEWYIKKNGWLYNKHLGELFVFQPEEKFQDDSNATGSAELKSETPPSNPKVLTDYGVLGEYKTMDEYYYDEENSKVWHGYRKNIYPSGFPKMIAYYEHGTFVWSEQYDELGNVVEQRGVKDISISDNADIPITQEQEVIKGIDVEGKQNIVISKEIINEYDSEIVLDSPEILPYFASCDDLPANEIESCTDLKIQEHIAANSIYPPIAKDAGIQGTVYVRFEVSKEGEVEKVEVRRGVDKRLDDEAVRAVKSLPIFEPGKQQGRNVRIQYTVPVRFTIK